MSFYFDVTVVYNRAYAGCRSQKFCCGTTPEEPPRALQTAECNAPLDSTRTRYVIRVQRQPGKFVDYLQIFFVFSNRFSPYMSLLGDLNQSSYLGRIVSKNSMKRHRRDNRGIGLVFN